MQIGTRVAAGFAVVVAISVAVGLVGWSSLSSVVAAAHAGQEVRALIMQVKAVHADVMRFSQLDDEELEAKIQSDLSTLPAQLDQVVTLTHWAAADQKAAADAIIAVSDSFAALVKSKKLHRESVDQLMAADETLTSDVNKFLRQYGDEVSDRSFREEMFALRLSLTPLGGAEMLLAAGRVDDATEEILAALRKFYASSLRLQQVGDERITGKLNALTDTLHNYRKEFETIRDAAAGRREAGKTIADAANRLEAMLTTVGERERAAMADVRSRAIGALQLGVLLGVIAGSVIAFFLTRSIVRPVGALTSTMQRLAERDLGVEVVGVDRNDEIGIMARTVEVFKRDAEEVSCLQAERSLRDQQAQEERQRERQRVADEIRASLGTLVEAVADAATRLEASAKALSSNSERTNVHAVSVSSAIRQTVANVEAISATTEQLAASAAAIGERAGESSSIAREAVDETDHTNEIMGNLSQSARDISAVVRLIQTVASQTNLLALNASIEAARAGEAGKGFAVVAGEVNNLARQTDQATNQIDMRIRDIQGEAEDAETALEKVSGIILRMREISSVVASTVENQSTAVTAIVHNLAQAAEGTREVSQGIDVFAQSASLTEREAMQVLDAASGLTRDARSLRQEIEAFISRICQE